MLPVYIAWGILVFLGGLVTGTPSKTPTVTFINGSSVVSEMKATSDIVVYRTDEGNVEVRKAVDAADTPTEKIDWAK